MGDDATFFGREGVARPTWITAFKALPQPPRDPELLARLIDAHAGTDLELGLVGLEADQRSARRDLMKVMTDIKLGAQSLRALQERHRNLDLLEIAMQDLFETATAAKVSPSYIAQVSTALECLAGVPLPPDLSSFAGKPSNDEAVQRIVDAIAEYYARQGINFTGAPRRTQTDDGPAYPLHSEQAKMTAAVLSALGLSVSDRSLATFMSKARKAAANLPT